LGAPSGAWGNNEMKKSKGITLIEIVIAVAIVGIVLSALLTGMNFAGGYARHTASRTMALNFSQGLLERIKDKDYEDPEDPADHTGSCTNYLGTENNDSGLDDVDDYNGYTDTVNLYQRDGVYIQAAREVDIRDQNESSVLDATEYANITYKQVTVTVTWDWQDNSYTEEVNTIISQHN